MSAWKDRILKRVVGEFDQGPENFLRVDGRKNFQKLADVYWSAMSGSKFMTEISSNLPNETVGNPFKFNKDKRISPHTVQHLYHLYIMREQSQFDITQSDLIVELGGGHGNICRLINHLGFSGEYIIVDFPEQWKIQRYFLENNGVDMSRITFIPLELHTIEEKLKSSNHTSLIGTYSINEMPISDRKHIEEFYNYFNYIFIIYKRNHFDGINNSEYFDNLILNNLKIFDIQHFKDQQHEVNRFLIGKKEI